MQSSNVGAFDLQSFLSGTPQVEKVNDTIVINPDDKKIPTDNQNAEPVTGDASVDNNTEKLKDFLSKDKEKKEGDEVKETEFFKDINDLYSNLKDKNLAYDFEDGKVETKEDLFNALQSSAEYNATQKVENLWKQKVDNLPEPLKKIHYFAEQGIATAQDLQRYMNSVAQEEVISTLDPTKSEDQERIILLHLMNTGMSEQSARDEVADLKDRKRLDVRSKEYFPSLKKSYEDNRKRIESEQAQIIEQETAYIEDNNVNVQFFLNEKNQTYLPFQITDPSVKKSIWEMGATVVGLNSDKEAVFKWEQYIKSLQGGDEASFKKYMKLMTFLADMENYDKSVSTKVSNDVNKGNFKQIIVPPKPPVNRIAQEEQRQQPVKAQANDNNSWSLR